MTRAYDEVYLNDAMKNLGEAVDYAVNAYEIPMKEFFELFIATGFAAGFEKGVPKIIAGMSGTELVHEIVGKAGIDKPLPSARTEYDYSEAYWCGWIIAYYQWYTDKSFREIFKDISVDDIEKLYPALHEASEDKFIDTMNSIQRRKNSPSKLQALRKNAGYSQRELAEKSGVNLRTLQQYESRAKDINKASAVTLLALTKTLGCGMEDLMER